MTEDEEPGESNASLFLQDLRRQDAVLSSLQRLFSCERRGLCLLREWTRHYGAAGSGCMCYSRFADRVSDVDY